MDTFGARLRALREARAWSQERLGFELDVTKATISKWENNRSEPGLAHLSLIRALFARDGLTLDHLVAASGMLADERATYEPRGQTENPDEDALLARFRQMPAHRRKALLELLEP